MKLTITRLSKLSVFVGLLGIFPQVFLMPATQAQSVVEQRLCGDDGRYAVFAIRPLDGFHWDKPPDTSGIVAGAGAKYNFLLAHAHIIFCNNHRIERNVGFGSDDSDNGGSRFSEDVTQLDYYPFDNERYDSKIISEILGPDSCRVSEARTFGVRTNNCQSFAARVRQEYWRKMFTGNWIATGYQCSGTFIEKVKIVINSGSIVATKVDSGGDRCVPSGAQTFSGKIPRNVSKGSSFPITYVVGNPNNPASGTATGQLTIVDANTLSSGSSTGEGITFRRAEKP